MKTASGFASVRVKRGGGRVQLARPGFCPLLMIRFGWEADDAVVVPLLPQLARLLLASIGSAFFASDGVAVDRETGR